MTAMTSIRSKKKSQQLFRHNDYANACVLYLQTIYEILNKIMKQVSEEINIGRCQKSA